MSQKKIITILTVFFLSGSNLIAQFGENTISQHYSRNAGFIENKGQVIDQHQLPNPAVKFLLCTDGLNVQLRTNGFSYDTYSANENPQQQKDGELFLPGKVKSSGRDIDYHFHRIDVELVNANSNPSILKSFASETYYNYFTTGTPDCGISNVHAYQSITYQNIYQGIDLQFLCSPGSGFKYNFIVHPGGDYKKIKLRYKGAGKMSLLNGEILISTSNGIVNEKIPLSYLEENDQQVKVNYKMTTGNEQGKFFADISFFISESPDVTKTLVIDPAPNLMWGTYYGGTGVDNATSITADPAGNVYVAGLTKSAANIATTGTYQVTLSGILNDAFVAKINSTGTALSWGTYYGASGNDMALSIALTTTGDLVITGLTSSTDSIATPGAWQTGYGGGSFDAFVAKFNTTGTALLWGTYYGGSSTDFGYALTVDALGDVFITGFTKSLDSICTGGAHQAVFGGGNEDAFVAKINAAGTNRIWGTYYGGTLDDWANAIVLDPAGNIYIAGYTSSPDRIATTGAWRITPQGNGDVFIAELDPAGTIALCGTYYGGTQEDVANDIAIDGQGNVIITGYTASISGIGTAGAWQTVFGGTEDVFLAKFDPACTNRMWGTYYGGIGDDEGYSLGIDATDNLFITGFTRSSSGISTPGSWQSAFGGNIDAFVAKFNDAGTNLEWGTYYGGSGQDEGISMALDGNNNLFMTGWTTSIDSISTAGTFQPSLNGTTNSFVAQFDGVNSGILIPGENYFSFNAGPVPTSGLLYLEINNAPATAFQITVVNLAGQTVLIRNGENLSGQFYETLDLSGYADGVYLVHVLAGEKSLTKKIVVRH